MAFSFVQKAWRATVVQGDSWKAEREAVQKWMATLGSPDLPRQVLQFNSESFWTGHFTYRMLNLAQTPPASFSQGLKSGSLVCRSRTAYVNTAP